MRTKAGAGVSLAAALLLLALLTFTLWQQRQGREEQASPAEVPPAAQPLTAAGKGAVARARALLRQACNQLRTGATQGPHDKNEDTRKN
jgi:hypothetical protein